MMNMRLTLRMVVILALGIALTGCQTTPIPYSAWEPISEKESMVAMVLPADQKSREITRKFRQNVYQVQEIWNWTGGELFLAQLSPGRYYPFTFETPDELKNAAKNWNRLKRMRLVIEDQDIEFTVGGAGRVIYSVSQSPERNHLCFVFMQAIGDADGGDSPGGYEASGGDATGYHCVRGDRSQKAKLVDTMLKVLDSAKLRE